MTSGKGSEIQNNIGWLFAAGGGRFNTGASDNSLFILSILTSIVSDRNNKRMPLGDDCHAWKKKTTDVKDHYDFKEVLGT